MSKWVEVPVTILKTYAVEIEYSETIDDGLFYYPDFYDETRNFNRSI